jgi:hypothetical protein
MIVVSDLGPRSRMPPMFAVSHRLDSAVENRYEPVVQLGRGRQRKAL